MLKICIGLLLIIEASQATDHIEICANLQCELADLPEEFPKTNEDLQKFCEPATEWLKCIIRYKLECTDFDPEEIQLAHTIQEAIKDICTEDTLLHAASQATEHIDICAKVECKLLDFPEEFLETTEDLQKICDPTTYWFNCVVHYKENCTDFEPEENDLMHKLQEAIKDICSEDTFLHAAIVNNLPCFSKLMKENKKTKLCPEQEGQTDRVQQFVESLTEEGLVSLTDNENDTYRIHYCIELMNYFACHSLSVEKECGTVAMDAYVEVVQRLGPGHYNECQDIYELLPALIHLHRLEGEKLESIAEAFRKRK